MRSEKWRKVAVMAGFWAVAITVGAISGCGAPTGLVGELPAPDSGGVVLVVARDTVWVTPGDTVVWCVGCVRP